MMKFSTEETTQDIALREVLQSALPSEGASPELRQRIAQMAQIADSKREMKAKKRATQLKLAFSGAVLASLIAVFALVWPQVMSNQALAQIDAAMARVSSVHMTRFRIEGAKKIKEGESWYQNGQLRDERISDGFASLTKGGKRWFYNALSGTVTVGAEPTPAKGRRPRSMIFTLSDIISDFKRQNDKILLTPQGQSTLNGRRIKRVLLETKSSYETTQIALLVDVETDLPLRAEISARTRYGKTGRWQMEMTYNRPLSAKLFEPKFTRGAKFIELGRRDADLKTRLARGLAKKRVGERVVAIRELEVNRQGDVFLFYTAGKRSGAKTGDLFDADNFFAGRDWKVFLTDSLGTRYSYLRYGTAGFSAPDVQGQRLEADRWVPANAPEPGARWKPRTFFVNFEMNPKNLHGSFKQTFVANYSARARLGIPIDEAAKSVVPPLADELLHLREETILKEAAEERGELPPGVEPLSRQPGN